MTISNVRTCRCNKHPALYTKPQCHRGTLAGQHFSSKAEAIQALESTPNEKVQSEYRQVVRVVDGDTIVLDGNEKVRLIGVDTPETKHPRKPVEYFGKEASAFTKRMVARETR